MAAPQCCIDGLKKSFGDVVALGGISLHAQAGKIFGLLGPNGAGKSTTVKILAGLIAADSGSVEIAGRDVSREPAAARAAIGYVPQEVTVDPYLTAREHLDFYASLYHLPASVRVTRVQEALEIGRAHR